MLDSQCRSRGLIPKPSRGQKLSHPVTVLCCYATHCGCVKIDRVERVLFTVHFYINRLCWGDVYNNTYSFPRWWKKLVYNCWKNKTGIFTRISSMSDVVKNISSVSRKKIRLQLARKRSNFCISTIKIHWTFELQEQFIRFVYMLLEEIHGTQFPVKKKKHLL